MCPVGVAEQSVRSEMYVCTCRAVRCTGEDYDNNLKGVKTVSRSAETVRTS